MKMDWVEKLCLLYAPVAVYFSDQQPDGAIGPQAGKRTCVIPFALAAFRGKTAVFSRQSLLCPGGKVGFCFGDYPSREWIAHFLSTGKEGAFEGEHYKKNPQIAADSIASLPFADISQAYVVMQPLKEALAAGKVPEVVAFYANAHQIAALTVLANYARADNENVVMPFGAGCQTLILLPYAEGKKEKMRAVVGLTDITVRPIADADKLTFAVPYAMYLEMQENAAASFLQRELWARVARRMELAETNGANG